MMINGKALKDCTDSELVLTFRDVGNTRRSVRDAIIDEMAVRRAMRAASPFQEPPVPSL